MMWPVFPWSDTVLVIGATFLLVLFSMRIVQPEWWRSRFARGAVLVAFGAMLAGLVLWGAGNARGSVRLTCTGAGLAYTGVLVVLPAAIVMPIAAFIDRVLRRRAPAPPAPDSLAPETETKEPLVSRRSLIRFGSAAIPAMAASAGVSGLAEGRRAPTIPLVRLRWPNLHPDLEGLRILHLSDLHLGACFGPEDLERGLELARAHRPDLIVVTGDVTDYPPFIEDAMRLIAKENARYGAFASLGNHEYHHDISVIRALYEASAVPLLCGSGRSIRIGDATLFVGGADDPVQMHGDIAALVSPSIEAAAHEAPAHADFRLLLCHRPEGHAPAAANGFDLTLAGHTHGGQIGLLGRSLFEQIKPGIGWWGSYAKARPTRIKQERGEREERRVAGPAGPSRLYTTSGFGHWFPFRIGCPTEMPIIVLEGERRGSTPDRV